MKPIVIIGSGGHARVLVDIAELLGYGIAGFSVPEKQDVNTLWGIPIIGCDEDLLNFSPQTITLANGLGSVSSLTRRYEVFKKFHERGFSFATLVHPSAIISKNTVLGEGTQVMAGAIIQPGTKIGANSIINTRASVDHDCNIGDHVHIAPGATLSGGVKIADGVHVGCSATIIQGITVGEWSLIGAGSLVIRNVKPRQMVMGVPAKVKRNIRDWKKILVPPGKTVKEVISIIDQESLQLALVIDEDSRLIGTVTDGDIRRYLIAGGDLSSQISLVMNHSPLVTGEKTRQEEVLSLMRENCIHQIPIVDRHGRVVGLNLLEDSLI